jgi:hypothetical protein
MVSDAATQRGVDPGDANALMMEESGGNPNVPDNKNKDGTSDHGLFQINDVNIHPGEEGKASDPQWSTNRGLDIYKQGLDRFGGDPETAAYAYNHGMGAAEHASPDTIHNDPYVKRFMSNRAPGTVPQATPGMTAVPPGQPSAQAPGAPVVSQGFPDHVGSNYAPPPTASEGAPDAPTAAQIGPTPAGDAKPSHVQPPIVPYGKPADASVWGFMNALVTGGVPEVTGAPGRMGAQTGYIINMGFAGIASAVDGAWDAMTGQRGSGVHHAAEDTVFDFDKNYIQPAIAYWTPKTASFVGDEGSGAVAKGMGGAAEMIAYGRMGLPGVTLMVGNSFFQSVTSNIDKGMDTNAAVTDATVEALASLAQMKLIGSDFMKAAAKAVPTAMIRRVISSLPTTAVINLGKDLTKWAALGLNGNDKEANAVDLKSSVSDAATYVENAIYGAFMPQHTAEVAGTKPGPGAPPPPGPSDVKPGAVLDKDIPPPPTTAQAAAPKLYAPKDAADIARMAAEGRPVQPVSTPDHPSAEPAQQIRAQLTDMRNPSTPRRGVLISPEGQAHLDSLPAGHVDADPIKNQIAQAEKQNRVVETPAGDLILKTKSDAISATSQLKGGADPQLVIGRYTGAGSGKSLDQTAVVQGREVSNGAITTERAVRPDEVGAARQSMLDQGKVPVVTTPEAVIQERAQDVNAEKAEAAAPEQRPTTDSSLVGAPGFDEQERRTANPPVANDRRATQARQDAANKVMTQTRAEVVHKEGDVFSPEQHAQDKADTAFDQLPPDHQQGVNDIMREEGRTRESAMKIWKGRNPDETPATPAKETPAPDTAKAEPAAPARSQEPVITPKVPVKAREGMFRLDNGKEVPVHITGDTAGGKTTIRPLDPETGEPGVPRDVPSERVRTGPRSKEPVQEAPVQEAPVQEAPPAKTAGTPLEQLPAALKTHEKQEAAVPGKKNAASLPDRITNAANFATALKAASLDARKNNDGVAVGPKAEARDRALNAATETLARVKTLKASDRGPQTTHMAITTRVKEMHAAARELLGQAKPEDAMPAPPAEPVPETAAEMVKRANQENADEADAVLARHKGEPTVEQVADAKDEARVAAKQKPVKADDIPTKSTPANIKELMGKRDISYSEAATLIRNAKAAADAAAKPESEEASPAEMKRMRTLKQRAVDALPEDLNAAVDALSAHVQKVAARLGQPEDQGHLAVDAQLNFVMEARARAAGEMGDEPEEVSEQQQRELSDERGFQHVSRPNTFRPSIITKLGRILSARWSKTTEAAGAAMEKLGQDTITRTGLYAKLLSMRDTGSPMSSHEILDHLLYNGTWKTPEDMQLRDRLMALRDRMPDTPTFIRSDVINPFTLESMGQKTRGLFSSERKAPSIQLQINDSKTTGYNFIATAIHEFEHGATRYETATNPTGRLATQLEDARNILINRLHDKYKTSALSDLMQKGPFYGLKDIDEMMAEIHSNPRFLEEVIRSEDHAQPGENIPPPRKGVPGLLMKIVKAVADFMGYKDPELALHIMDLSQRTADSQRSRNPNLYTEGALRRATAGQHPDFIRALARLEPHGDPGGRMDDHYFNQAQDAEDEMGELMKAPEPIRAQGEIRGMVGSEAMDSAKTAIHAIGSRAADLGRNAVMSLKTMGQIFRDGKLFFGPDDERNPLNQLRQVMWDKNKLMAQMRAVTNPVAKAWQRLGSEDNLKVSQLMIDTRMWKIDPRVKSDDPSTRELGFRDRYTKLSPEARNVYDTATDANKTTRGMERRAAIDSALEGFGIEVTPEQRTLLYGAKDTGAYDRLIGEGKLGYDGEHAEKLKDALKEWLGSESPGPYHHLGRPGEYIVQATPEGTKEFGAGDAARRQAEAFAEQVRNESPNSESKKGAEFVGGKWQVQYKVDHVSAHQTRPEAEKALAALRARGFDTADNVIRASSNHEVGATGSGLRELMTSAIKKITRDAPDGDKGAKALVDSLQSAYLQMKAGRSASAGSRLASQNFAGVQAKDMRQNFADHASSSMYHTAQVRTVFRQAVAMSRLRNMVRGDGASQNLAYHRSEVVNALNDRASQEAAQLGHSVFSAKVAQLGFMSYLASPAHAAVWLTQNFTTGLGWAGARYGYRESTAAFYKGGMAVLGPAVRATFHDAIAHGFDADKIHEAVSAAIAQHPTMGKWADAIRELGARGVITHSYSHELAQLAKGKPGMIDKATNIARLLPAMADAINRTSTALAGLELTGGDLSKAAEMVEAIHADYSAANKPRAFRAMPAWARSTLMFKTYAQEMAHMTYSNAYAATKFLSSDMEAREAAKVGAKTIAGLAIGAAAFGGVYGGTVGLEPLRLLTYAYHKIFDKEGEGWDMKNAVHGWLTDTFGQGVGNSLARGPIADALGVDMQSRMGLANLFFHDPPDLLTTDKDAWKSFITNEGGPMVQWMMNGVTGAMGHLQNGEYLKAVGSVMPIKLVQDGLQALDMLNTGKPNSAGVPITKPSGLDAFKKVLGFQPADVADAQEKARAGMEITKAQSLAKSAIIKAIIAAPSGSPERDAANDRKNSFNDRNPGATIKWSDIRSTETRDSKIERDVPSKNQVVQQQTRWSNP